MAQGRVRTLFVIDVLIAIAFITAGMSALAFLIPYSTIDFSTSSIAPTFLGLTYGTWRTMHLYSGLTMILGGAVHFSLHMGWMLRVGMSMIPGTKHARHNAVATSTVPAFAEEASDVQ